MADLIIKGGIVLTMDGAFIDNGTVVVDNGLITFVGKDTKEKADKVIDARGCAVMPGLINAHTHVPMTLFHGYADGLSYGEWIKKIQLAEMNLTPADVRSGAYLGVLEMIRSGTTTFADMYFHEDEVAQVVQGSGLRAALGYGMIEGLNEDAETKLKSREKFAKKWKGAADGRITTMYAPHSSVSCSKEFLIRVKELAARDNSRVHIHVLETENELKTMKERYGMCSINHLNSIGLLGSGVVAAHCIWLSDDDIDILKDKDGNVVHCPSSNMALGAGIAPVPQMLEKGINVALGTDGAASGGSLDMWKEMRSASLLHRLKDPRAMPAYTVLKMATVNGARALGINAGALAPGKLADIIVVDIKKPQFMSPNPVSALVHGASGCDVRTTIVNGKVLMEDRRVVGLDEEKIIRDAGYAMRNIIE
ncbi:MAG: amidohydrolase family protein [Euryarchaeota archaeon]|nr:amidohydrolase family protein [Euryarchaeota archaeon]MBU4139693.1 amidohydrolase family protein [Euryarchaeota archaeon]